MATEVLNRKVDPRDTLQRLRRKELEKIIRHHGLPWQPSMGAETMRIILRDSGIMNADGVDLTADPVDQDDMLSSMSLFELRKVCSQRNVDWLKTDKKPDLLVKLGVEERSDAA